MTACAWKMMGRWVLAVVILAGCGEKPEPMGLSNGSIAGRVFVTGPVAGATVTAYAFDPDAGEAGDVIGVSEPTMPDGQYHVDLGPYQGPVLLSARGVGATYVEPASGVTIAWDSSTRLRALYTAWTPSQDLGFSFPREAEVTSLVISPWSELAVTYADARLQGGRSPTYPEAAQAAYTRFRDHLEHDFWETMPADLTAGPTTGWNESVQAGVELAGLSMLTRRAADASSITPSGLTSLQLLALLLDDLADSKAQLDGSGLSGSLVLGNCTGLCELSGRTGRQDLAESIALFLGSTSNSSGIGVTDAQALLERISARESDLFPAGGSPEFDTVPPTIAVDGLQEADILLGTRAATITVFDAVKMGEVAITFLRNDLPISGFYEATTESPDAQTRVVTLTIDSAELNDGPLLLRIDATDDAGNAASTVELTLLCDNSPLGHVGGAVVLGGRVVGARVRAWEYDGGVKGDKLGEDITDENGTYFIEMAESTAEVILVQADNAPGEPAARYIEGTSGSMVELSADDVIETAITGWVDGDERPDGMITPWTHAATAFARGLFATRYASNPVAWATAVDDAFGVIEEHFADAGTWVALRAVQPADLTAEGTSTLNAQARYGLFNAALGQLADAQAALSGTTSASMNTLTLTKLLGRDLAEDGLLAEPLWNGRTASGPLVHGTVSLDSYLTRVDLAVAAVAFLETNPNNATPFLELDVATLLDHLSTDDNPRLYPAGETPIPYDVIAPAPVVFTDPTPGSSQVLRGLVSLRAEASDNRALGTFAWTAPLAISSSLVDTSAGRPGPWVLTGTLNTDALPEGDVTVWARATDEAAQWTDVSRMLVVDRTSPAVVIDTATAGGFELARGGWTSLGDLSLAGGVTELHPAAARVSWNGSVSGLTVSGDGGWVTSTSLAEGANTVVVTATDQAGNAGSDSATYYRDSASPVVTIASAVSGGGVVVANGGATSSSSLTISGTVLEPNLSGATSTWNGTSASLVVGAGGAWTIDVALSEGSNVLEVEAVDLASNAGTASSFYLCDRTLPVVTITGATKEGVPLAEGGWTGPGSINVTGQVSDANLTSASYRWNGGAWLTLALDAGGAWTLPLVLQNGANTLEVSAMDIAGNASGDTATWNSDQVTPTVTVVANPALYDEASWTATVGGVGVGTVSYSGPVVGITLDGSTAASFTKYASRYTSSGPNLPEWRFLAADDRSAGSTVVVGARLSRLNGPGWTVLKDWWAIATAAGAGFNRAQAISDSLHVEVGQLGGTYRLEYQAQDELGNSSSIGAVQWIQSIKPPPVRQRAGAACNCMSDLQCAQHYGLSSSCSSGGTSIGANTASVPISGVGLPDGKLRIGSGLLDNPNPVAVRVKLSIASPTTYARGTVWVHPQVADPSGLMSGCAGGLGDMLLDGSCYTPGSAEQVVATASAGDLYAGFTAILDGTPLPLVGTNEIQIPAMSTAAIWVLSNPYTFLLSDSVSEIGTVGSTLLNVTGLVGEDWLDCTASIHPPGEMARCTNQVKKRSIQYLTRVVVMPSTAVSLQARPASASATWSAAIGTNVTGFAYGNSAWSDVEDGW